MALVFNYAQMILYNIWIASLFLSKKKKSFFFENLFSVSTFNLCALGNVQLSNLSRCHAEMELGKLFEYLFVN